MVNIQEHLNKIEQTQKQVDNSKGQQKLQYLKCLHKLKKQALQYYLSISNDKDIKYIKYIKN